VQSKADHYNEQPPHTLILRMVERLDSEAATIQAGMLWARLLFKTPGGSTTRLADVGFERSKHGPPAVLGRVTASHPEFGLARKWISDCHMHAGCSITRCQLPTRLIDIGFEGRTRDPRLVMTAGSTGQYVALSHCWGTPSQRPLMTTAENMASLLECIPLTSMAKTFQDAVIVTRELGYRFLWIDVYCIVQDDPQDWQRECGNMASIFENASVTIAASAAADSNTDFLRQRPDWQANITEWARFQSSKYQNQKGDICPLYFHVGGSSIRAMVTSISGGEEAGFPYHYFLDSKNDSLAERAWAVQERLLSPRVLSFYDNQMVFECNTCLRYEKLHHGLTHRDGEHIRKDRSAVTPKDFLDTDDQQILFGDGTTFCSVTRCARSLWRTIGCLRFRASLLASTSAPDTPMWPAFGAVICFKGCRGELGPSLNRMYRENSANVLR
jgi:hypothetical protein